MTSIIIKACLFSLAVFAFQFLTAGNSRSLSMGGTSTHASGVLGTGLNPALTTIDSYSALSFNSSLNQFIHALSEFSLAYSQCNGKRSFGAQIQQMGDRRLQTLRIDSWLAMALTENLSMGVNARLIHLAAAPPYGSLFDPQIDLGMHLKISEQLMASGYIFNAGRSELIKEFNERGESFALAGIHYKATSSFNTVFETEVNNRRGLVYRFGFEYEVSQSFFIRSGYESDNKEFGLGCGIYKGLRNTDLCFQYNSELGFTFSLGFRMDLVSKKQAE